jgi:GDSL-like Lipase/Acylhydrolase family
MSVKKSDLFACSGCGMYGTKDGFVDESASTCRKCERVGCLEARVCSLEKCLEAEARSVETMTKSLESVIKRISALEGTSGQKKDGNMTEQGEGKKDLEEAGQGKMGKSLQQQKEQKTEKVGSIQRKDKVLFVGDSLVRYVGRNLQRQCAGFETVCKPGARIEQMLPEIQKRETKDDTVIVQAGTNNLRMDEIEEVMSKYEGLIQGLKGERKGEVVIMGILPRQDLSEALDGKRMEINRRLKSMCVEEMVRYCEVDFNPWKGGYLGRDGLHLNARGADMVGRQLFMMMKNLNLVGRRLAQ